MVQTGPTPFFAAAAAPTARRLVALVWLFAAIVMLVLVIALHSIGLLSAGRAFVGGEGLWSKSQKQAVFHLARYAQSREERDWQAYLGAMAVPLGDRRARIELEKGDPDLEIAREGLLAGRNHPDDIEGMIQMVRWFRGVDYIERVLVIWAQADAHIEELMGVAQRIRENTPGSEETRRLLAEIDRIDAALTPLEDEFSFTLGEAQRVARTVLQVGLIVLCALLLLGAIAVSNRVFRQNADFQAALRDNERQLQLLIDTAPLPLMIVRRVDQLILYANERARAQFGIAAGDMGKHQASEFYAEPGDRQLLLETIERDGLLRDRELLMRDLSGRRFWMLVSSRNILYADADCLLTALHDIDDRKHLQDDMQFRAFHDELTGLPNRAMFMDALDRVLKLARRKQTRCSVLFIDLDRFKIVNDTLGHGTGDRLLQDVAQRLRSSVRESDLVARLGGDEFVVLVEEHGGPEEVAIVAGKVLERLQRPFVVNWREVNLTASLGISSYPGDGEDLEALVKAADVAMYQAKDEGRNNFRFYAPSLNKLTMQRFDLEARLRGALEREELVLHYQPVVDLATGVVCGAEALIRWQDPASGLVYPAEFVPLAEETGTIIAIGRWVLQRACRDAASWQAAGLGRLSVAVNISARQFLHDELVRDVRNVLDATGLDPRSLELEITETMVIHDLANAERALRALKDLGVRLAIDDFGTGYSSLSLIRRFPVDTVKVDGSFVAGMPGDRGCVAIVHAVASMAHTLGLMVVAEGVETEAQRAAVRLAGCERAQGFFFSAAAQSSRFGEIARTNYVERASLNP